MMSRHLHFKSLKYPYKGKAAGSLSQPPYG
nr:MAG TPA: hypothetical protein [Caudoviricetes sp.]